MTKADSAAVDAKLVYLAKALSRTRRKDYENYVVNAVWQRLGRTDVKPVSQQYIRKPDGGHYFIDLYFPAVNMGVECDEGHHKSQVEADMMREVTIADILGEVGSEGYEALHVDVTRPFGEVEAQIDEAVGRIRERIGEVGPEPWEEVSADAYFAARDEITVHEDYGFATISETCNALFATEYRGAQQRSYFTPASFRERGIDAKLWFPKLSPDGRKAPAGWVNILSLDGLAIWEKREAAGDRHLDDSCVPDETRRITFAKVTNAATGLSYYRFVGVFTSDGLEIRGDYRGFRRYGRVDDRFAILKKGRGYGEEPMH